MTIRTTMFVAISILFALGCGGGGDGDNGGDNHDNSALGPSTGSVDVDWGEETVVLGDDAASKIVSFDRETGELVFANGTPGVDTLTAGQIVIVPGETLRRIDRIERRSSDVLLETSYATLPEAIEKGQIEWDQAITFGDDALTRVDGLEPVGDDFATRRGALGPDGIKWSGELDGYDIEVELKPSGGGRELGLTLSMTKNPGGNTRKFGMVVEGKISDFRAGGRIDIEDHSVRDFEYEQRGLSGELKVTAAGVELGIDEPFFEVPVEMTFPMRLGVIPVEVKLKAVVRMVAQLQVPGASSRIEVAFVYDADYGFRLDDGKLASTTDRVTNKEIDVSDAVSAANGPAAGMGIGIQAPRVEVGFFGETLVPYVTLDHYFSSVFTFDPACQSAAADFKAIVGLQFKLLGFELFDGNQEIFREETAVKAGAGCE